MTGDGAFDIVAGAVFADRSGHANAGAIYVFEGGALGSQPDFTLAVSGAVANDNLGFIGGEEGQGIQLCDLTGDGILDIVAGASNVSVQAFADVGAIYVWPGNTSIAQSPTFTLSVSDARAGDRALAAGL